MPKPLALFPEKMAVVCRNTHSQPVSLRATEIAGTTKDERFIGIWRFQIDIGMAAQWFHKFDLGFDEVVISPRRQMLRSNAKGDRRIRRQLTGTGIHLVVIDGREVCFCADVRR